MGGRPSKGTSKDMRLSKNNPNASKGKTTPPVQPTKPAVKKAGGKA